MANTTQRSWSDYVGNNPIKSKQGTGFYADSARYNPGAAFEPPGGKPPVNEPVKPAVKDTMIGRQDDEESNWEKLQRESALKRSMRAIQEGSQITSMGGMIA